MKKSFTLIELLIVLVIIGVIVTLAVPQYMIIREKAIAVEAIQMMGTIKNSIEQDVEEYDTPTLMVISEQSRYWKYTRNSVLVDDNDPSSVCLLEVINLKAARKSGPYENTTINLTLESKARWWGSHPGVPKN